MHNRRSLLASDLKIERQDAQSPIFLENEPCGDADLPRFADSVSARTAREAATRAIQPT